MLSSVALRSGALRVPLKHAVPLTFIRSTTTNSPDQFQDDDNDLLRKMKTRINRWDKANEIFYGPERDTKNFPHYSVPEYHPKVRMGFIPDSWFQMLYPKTGVTGPYFFLGGLTTYLISKEIFVVDHGFIEAVAFVLAVTYATKKFGKGVATFLDKKVEAAEERLFNLPDRMYKQDLNKLIDHMENQNWQIQGMKEVFPAKKENVDLQLEAEFRRRQQDVYKKFKNLLDYQVNFESTQRRFQQEHMVNWIVENVKKSITPQQEKESISRCITDLKAMAARAATV